MQIFSIVLQIWCGSSMLSDHSSSPQSTRSDFRLLEFCVINVDSGGSDTGSGSVVLVGYVITIDLLHHLTTPLLPAGCQHGDQNLHPIQNVKHQISNPWNQSLWYIQQHWFLMSYNSKWILNVADSAQQCITINKQIKEIELITLVKVLRGC